MTTTTPLFTREGKPYAKAPTTNEKGRVGYWKLWKVCTRCGGAGGSDKWKHTGWKCFECQNTNHARVDGYDLPLTHIPANIFRPLYTAEQLEKLNASQAKAEATRARKAAEKAAAEAARREAERKAVIEAHADILARIAPWAEVSGFLADMAKQVTEKVRPLSERQLEAATNACAKFEAEKARREVAAHVGTVGERVTLDLTYVRHIDLTRDKFDPLFIIWTFRTEEGNTVVFKGGEPKAFDAIYEWHKPEGGEPGYYRIIKGAKLRLKATIKAHEHNRKTGEPETIIQRPAAV